MAATTEADFERRIDPYRGELLAHCYQLLGSVHDAEDLVQETLLRAWRAYHRFDPGRASLRTWLHRIATNACLTALDKRSRRPLPSGIGAPDEDPTRPPGPMVQMPWVEPFPDARLDGDPAAVLLRRGRLRLALIAAMQELPARQRAVLILREVLGWSAAETAGALDLTTAAVNSALQRARARLRALGATEEQVAEPGDPDRRAVLDRYMAAFEAADMAALSRLLADDVVLEMPPALTWYSGAADYVRFIAATCASRGRVWRMRRVRAGGSPAAALYLRDDAGEYRAHSLQVLDITPAGIARNVVYVDPAQFATFALPLTLRRSRGGR